MFIHGKTEEFTKECIIMTKNRDMVSINGLMVENTKVNGMKESSMVMEFMLCKKIGVNLLVL